MTLRNGLFVRKDDNKGTTPIEARLALAGVFSAPGVLEGLVATGRASWAYNVAAGTLVSRRSASDGVVLFANDSPAIVGTDGEGTTIPPAPGTGSRIDIIYALHRDVDNADPNSAPVFGVASGTASGSPTPPSIPAGAVELARAVVSAGATNTAHANVTISHSSTPRASLRGSERSAGVVTPIGSGWAVSSATVRSEGRLACMTGSIARSAANAAIGTGFTQVASIPTEFAPPDEVGSWRTTGYNSAGQAFECAITPAGAVSLRGRGGGFTWATGTDVPLSMWGTWPRR